METPPTASSLRHSLLVPEIFADVRMKVRSGKITRANTPSYRRLLAGADFSLGVVPPSVLDKKHVPPSGDKRDYFSLSVYFWPDGEAENGLPYVPRDGQVNPETADYDRPGFEAMCGHVDVLSLAYALSGEERFAAKAASFLRTWFLDESTGMNPHMLFAQYIPGENVELPWKDYPARFVPGTDGRSGVFVSFGGVIEDLHLVPLTDCLGLLRESKHWSDADHLAMVRWYAAYTEWLLTHQHGLDEAACRNNHGSWYWADILCFLNFIGQPEKARGFLPQKFAERFRLQIEPDGSQPEELVRTISQSYTAFSLCSFSNMAVSASQSGFEAWSWMTGDGRSIVKAMDWFLPYLTGEKAWAWKQIKPFAADSIVGSLAACSHGTGNPKYRDAIRHLPGLASDNTTRLLYGESPSSHKSNEG